MVSAMSYRDIEQRHARLPQTAKQSMLVTEYTYLWCNVRNCHLLAHRNLSLNRKRLQFNRQGYRIEQCVAAQGDVVRARSAMQQMTLESGIVRCYVENKLFVYSTNV